MRKFLKQVGVTSQQAIEEAMRGANTSGKTFEVTAVVEMKEMSLNHVVTGRITGKE